MSLSSSNISMEIQHTQKKKNNGQEYKLIFRKMKQDITIGKAIQTLSTHYDGRANKHICFGSFSRNNHIFSKSNHLILPCSTKSIHNFQSQKEKR